MAMKETVGSLRAYLILSGLLGAVSYLGPLSEAEGLAAVILVAGLFVALLYLYLGVRLKHLLSTAPNQPLLILRVGAGYLILVCLLAAVGGDGLAGSAMAVVGLLMTWYVYANIRRLGAAGAGVDAASPPTGRQERPCPACAEPVLVAARKCKHCGSEIEG